MTGAEAERLTPPEEGEEGGEATGEHEGKKLVNVNNLLVPEDTMLTAGDLVVLSDQVLSNV